MEEFKSINDILDFAINSEQDAINFYTDLAKNSDNDAMAEAFIQFAKEEKGHKARLIKIKETEVIKFKNTNVLDLKIGDYLVDIEPTPEMTYQQALILAMKREKSAFKLYSNLASIAPNAELKKVFLSLAQEEAKHKLRFEIEYDENVLKEN